MFINDEKGYYKPLIKESFKNFKEIFLKVLIFEGIFKTLTSFILIPGIALLFHKIMKSIGKVTVFNEGVFKVGLNLKGFLGILFIGIICVLIIFIEFGVLVVFSEKQYFNKPVSILTACIISLKRFPRIFGIGLIQFGIYLFLILPFTDLFFNSSLLSKITLPKFIEDEIFKSTLYLSIYVFFMILGIYMFLRWCFTIHSIIIEKRKITASIKRSVVLTRKKHIKIILSLFLVNIIAIVLLAILLIILIFIFYKVSNLLDINILGGNLDYISTVLIVETYFFISLIATPFNIVILTNIYYKIRIELGENLKDEINDVNIGNLKIIDGKLYDNINKKRKSLFLIFTVFVTISITVGYFFTDNMEILTRNTLVAAHRGDSIYYPENSLGAIKDAINEGANYVEIDLQETLDGQVVVFHDKNLKRLTGVNKNLSEMTYREIEALNLGKNQKIPTFEEVLKTCKGKIKVLAELKPYYKSTRESLANKAINLIKNFEMESSCNIQSLDYESLKIVRKIEPSIKIGYIFYIAAGEVEKLDVDFYSVEQSIINKTLVRKIHSSGKKIWTWTVNDVDDMDEMMFLNVDGIITDNLKGFKEAISLKYIEEAE